MLNVKIYFCSIMFCSCIKVIYNSFVINVSEIKLVCMCVSSCVKVRLISILKLSNL